MKRISSYIKIIYEFVFSFSKDVISVRLGCKLPKQVAMNFRSTKNKRGHWKFICIEGRFSKEYTCLGTTVTLNLK